MIVLLNGQFVAEEEALVSVFDRGFLYGDGVFETIRVAGGRPFRLADHMERVEAGMITLGIQAPHSRAQWAQWAAELVRRNQQVNCLLRLCLSRGVGARGYSPRGADRPTIVMSLHPLPADLSPEGSRLRVITSRLHLPPADPLTRIKSANKLLQVLARAEADVAGADEALLTDAEGFVAEASGANVFWWQGARLETAPLSAGALPGITRRIVLEWCAEQQLEWGERKITVPQLLTAEGVFLTNSARGILPVASVDQTPIQESSRVRELAEWYQAVLSRNIP